MATVLRLIYIYRHAKVNSVEESLPHRQVHLDPWIYTTPRAALTAVEVTALGNDMHEVRSARLNDLFLLSRQVLDVWSLDPSTSLLRVLLSQFGVAHVNPPATMLL